MLYTSGKGKNSSIALTYFQVDDFPSAETSSFRSRGKTEPVVGHYTQVVWAESSKVGCGFMEWKQGAMFKQVSYFKQKSKQSLSILWTIQHFASLFQTLVCNYGPGANMIGSAVYEAGATASACAKGSENGLCLWGLDEDQNINCHESKNILVASRNMNKILFARESPWILYFTY